MILPTLSLLLAQLPSPLPETIVVETRQPAPLAEASPSVSRLDVAAATESGLTTLAGLLGGVPGVFVTEANGDGSAASVFVRGTNSSHTAVLLDGRRLPQGFSNNYELGRYRIFGLASVEMLRGPSSSLYGANALGGVIDLRQRSPLEATPGSAVVTEAGSYGRGSLSLSFLANDASGTQAATRGTAVSVSASHDDGYRPNGDREALSTMLKQEWRLSPGWVLDLVGTADVGAAGLPGPDVGGSLIQRQGDRGWLFSPGLRYEDELTQATVFWSRGFSAATWTGGFAPTRYVLDRDELTAFVDRKVRPDLSIGLGISYERTTFDQYDHINGIPFYLDTHASLGVNARADWRITAADRVRATVRKDRFTDHAGKTTGEVAYSRRLTDALLAHAKVGTAYRAPSANDLAYGTYLGLPLRPESNRGAEIGLRYDDRVPGALAWTVVAFRNDLTDLVDFIPALGYQAFNIGAARTQGIEAGVETRPAKGLRLFGTTTWLDTEIVSAEYAGTGSTGEPLLRRPSLALSVGAEVFPREDWVLGISAVHLRGRDDFDFTAFNRVELPDATFVRVWLRHFVSERTEVSLRIENLFGEAAPSAAFGFGPRPRSAYVGLTSRF